MAFSLGGFRQKVVRTVVGTAVHTPEGRQPIVPTSRTGLGAANVATVPAVAVRNPFQRYNKRAK